MPPTSSQSPAAAPIPLVALCGFLGAGKTTLLRRILAAASDRKIGVVVNDLATTNIDEALLLDAEPLSAEAASRILGLSSGCVCCSLQDGLAEALAKLAHEVRPELVVVEASGVADPYGILNALQQSDPRVGRLLDRYYIQSVVTLVDGPTFARSTERKLARAPRRPHLLTSDPRRPLAELILSQIDAATLILLNKIDLLAPGQTERLATTLETLNPAATVLPCHHSAIDPQRFFNPPQTPAPAPQPTPRPSSQDYGLRSFVYQARQPFHEPSFLKYMRRSMPGLLRAKGYFWTTAKPERIGALSLACDVLRADYLGKWYWTRLDEGSIDRSQIPPSAQKAWLPTLGDRRQELVFIGIDLDAPTITTALNACLVS